jgi:tetratricopeptide (TPR) repeat protein
MTILNIKNQLNNALKEHHNGNIDAADKIYLEILEHDKDNFDANHLHGLVLSQKKEFSKSINFYRQAFSANSNNVELLNNYSISLRNIHNFKKCEDLLKRAINHDPSFLKSYLNLSNCYENQDKYEEAISVIKKGRLISPESIDFIKREINCCIKIYIKTKNNEDLDRLITLIDRSNIENSKDIRYISMCSMAYVWNNQLTKANDLFKLTEKLSQTLPTIEVLKQIKEKNILRTFIKHEYEQLCHIDSDDDGIRNMKISQSYFDKVKHLYEKNSLDFNDDELVTISSAHKILYNKPIKLEENYLNPKLNIDQIEKTYNGSDFEIVVIDDFLSNKFLDEINTFFRCSNIFKRPYPRGYIGAFLNQGMSNIPILKFSKELKDTFKKIFFNYQLSQAWAFKYDSNQEGIDIHADHAKVNVNFWITPDEANLDINTGGMIIWKKKPNIDASFYEFNSLDSSKKLYKEVKDVESMKVPYKANRVVIFNSKLYHVTDKINFRKGYKNRRVNVTFLYD